VYSIYQSNKEVSCRIAYDDEDEEDLEAQEIHEWVDKAERAKPSPESAAELDRRVKLRVPEGVLVENNRVEKRKPTAAAGKHKAVVSAILENSESEEDESSSAVAESHSSDTNRAPASKRHRPTKQLTLDDSGVTSPPTSRSPESKKPRTRNNTRQLSLDDFFGATSRGKLQDVARSTNTSALRNQSARAKRPIREKLRLQTKRRKSSRS
jgi:hypothetical protein